MKTKYLIAGFLVCVTLVVLLSSGVFGKLVDNVRFDRSLEWYGNYETSEIYERSPLGGVYSNGDAIYPDQQFKITISIPKKVFSKSRYFKVIGDLFVFPEGLAKNAAIYDKKTKTYALEITLSAPNKDSIGIAYLEIYDKNFKLLQSVPVSVSCRDTCGVAEDPRSFYEGIVPFWLYY
ncbi:hypothetical protein HYW76_04110 [Candidatus Pacearchaeota archaeon]|nr:hypothetical protein [Candidatus Pacearchaeota archaeon]